jgi:hypothetical protein
MQDTLTNRVLAHSGMYVTTMTLACPNPHVDTGGPQLLTCRWEIFGKALCVKVLMDSGHHVIRLRCETQICSGEDYMSFGGGVIDFVLSRGPWQ